MADTTKEQYRPELSEEDYEEMRNLPKGNPQGVLELMAAKGSVSALNRLRELKALEED
jgi:hypothetical protein